MKDYGRRTNVPGDVECSSEVKRAQINIGLFGSVSLQCRLCRQHQGEN
jgi:hypothetical protein